MQHLLEIYNHLSETKSQRFTDKRKAEMLSADIIDAWDQRKVILLEATPEEIVQLVIATHLHPPLFMSMVKQLKHQSCIRVVNALISLLDMANITQVLRHCHTIAPTPPEDSDDDDDKDYDPPLVTAIMKKDIPIGMIEMLLQEGCDPNSRIANKGPVSNEIYASNNSSLYCALHQNRRDIVKLLLEKGATVTNDHYNNGFHDSMSADIITCIDDYTMVKLLLDHGADPNSSYYDDEGTMIPDDDGTALILAIFNGNLPVVQLLIDRGATIDHVLETDDYSGTAVDFAYSVACGGASETWEITKWNDLENQVYWNKTESSATRSAIFKVVYKHSGPYNETLLRDAMLRPNCQEFAQMMLDTPADLVNVTERVSGKFDTPLLCILMNYQGYRGTTTREEFLEFCSMNPEIFQSSDIKKILSGPIIQNADIFKYCQQKSIDSDKVITSLHFSDTLSCVLPQLQEIIERTNDINACATSENHEAPLHCAMEHCSRTVLAMLLADKRINVHVQDELGDTALQRCRRVNVDIQKIDMLLDAGCNVDHQNFQGKTTLFELCAWYDDETHYITHALQTCEKLLKAGADPNKADNEGRTPVSIVRNSAVSILLLNCGGRIQDAPNNYQVEYREYRTQLNNENRTNLNLPDLVRLAIQRFNGIHCERCHKLIVGDSRKDGNGQMCMECYNRLARKAIIDTKSLYTQWVKP